MKRKLFMCTLTLMLIFVLTGCSSSTNTNGAPDPDKIVPSQEVLVENLENSGYTVTTLDAIENYDLTVDRVKAEKGDKFIDIVYGLSDEDSDKVFELYCEIYPDDYYILAQNGNYVYCVSDKKTFSKAGFTTTDNVGEQYIND